MNKLFFTSISVLLFLSNSSICTKNIAVENYQANEILAALGQATLLTDNHISPEWFFEENLTPKEYRKLVIHYLSITKDLNIVKLCNNIPQDLFTALQKEALLTTAKLHAKQQHHFWKIVRRAFIYFPFTAHLTKEALKSIWAFIKTANRDSQFERRDNAPFFLAFVWAFAAYKAASSGNDHYSKYMSMKELLIAYKEHIQKPLKTLQ